MKNEIMKIKEHCVRVARIALNLANALNFPVNKKIAIYIAALNHDIGKFRKDIFDIIIKPRALTDKEKKIVSEHAKESVKIFRANSIYSYFLTKDQIKDVIRIIKNHHKPKKLDEALVFIADQFDAMVTRYNWKERKGPCDRNEAIKKLTLNNLLNKIKFPINLLNNLF